MGNPNCLHWNQEKSEGAVDKMGFFELDHLPVIDGAQIAPFTRWQSVMKTFTSGELR